MKLTLAPSADQTGENYPHPNEQPSDKGLSVQRLVRLAGMHETITAEAGWIIDWWPPSENCPQCSKRGHERSGAEFQHQNRCWDCGIVWSLSTGYLRIMETHHHQWSDSCRVVKGGVTWRLETCQCGASREKAGTREALPNVQCPSVGETTSKS